MTIDNGVNSDYTAAADDIGGVHYFRTKLNVGANNAAVDVEPPDADAKASSAALPAAGMVWNGASWDRARGGNSADGGPGTGVPGVIPLHYDGSVYRAARSVGAMGADAVATQLPGAGGYRYNGATWDGERGNTEGTLYASAARTAGSVSAMQTNYNARGVIVFLHVTVASGTGGLTVVIYGQAPVGASAAPLHATPTPVTTAGAVFIYELYPGVSGLSGTVLVRQPAALPRQWYVSVGHGDASSYTYSVSYSLVV